MYFFPIQVSTFEKVIKYYQVPKNYIIKYGLGALSGFAVIARLF